MSDDGMKKPMLYYWDRKEAQPDGTVLTTHRWVALSPDSPREEIGPIDASCILATAHLFEMGQA